MVNIRCSASDRMRVPARPAQHVHRRVPDLRRRTRRSASTIGGGTPDMTIGRAAADQAGARPYHLQWRIMSLVACGPGSRSNFSNTIPTIGGTRSIARKSHERVGSSSFRAKPSVLRTSKVTDAASSMPI